MPASPGQHCWPVRVVRWCCLDWHYRTGVRATLTREETEAVLGGELDLTGGGREA